MNFKSLGAIAIVLLAVASELRADDDCLVNTGSCVSLCFNGFAAPSECPSCESFQSFQDSCNESLPPEATDEEKCNCTLNGYCLAIAPPPPPPSR